MIHPYMQTVLVLGEIIRLARHQEWVVAMLVEVVGVLVVLDLVVVGNRMLTFRTQGKELVHYE